MGSIINPSYNKPYVGTSLGITVFGTLRQFDTYQEMISTPFPPKLAWVVDATGDETVSKGSAMYEYIGGTYEKRYETEVMDFVYSLDFSWANLKDKPASTVSNIDLAVNRMHTHANKSTIDQISVINNALCYNGNEIILTNTIGNISIKSLSDISDVTPENGQYLRWNTAAGEYIPGNADDPMTGVLTRTTVSTSTITPTTRASTYYITESINTTYTLDFSSLVDYDVTVWIKLRVTTSGITTSWSNADIKWNGGSAPNTSNVSGVYWITFHRDANGLYGNLITRWDL